MGHHFMTAKRLAFAAMALGLACAAARGDERILRYHSDIEVHSDGWLTVTETIRVRAEGKEIQRGIYRDIPTVFRGMAYTLDARPVKIVRVLRDGAPEAYHCKEESDFLRVYAGRENVLLQPGVYTYTITYRTDGQLRFFSDHDELYWNVTGNFWSFPIDSASATVTLPAGADRAKVKTEAYTGLAGGKGKDWRAGFDASGRPTVVTTAPLAKGEGLTVVVSFPKNLVPAPTPMKMLLDALFDNAHLAVGLAALLAVLAYYFAAWWRVGRDPAEGLIVPLFEPPENLSAAAVRFVWKLGFDRVCFVAAVVGAAAKGHVAIEEPAGGEYRLGPSRAQKRRPLCEEERLALEKLSPPIEVKQANHAKFQAAIKALKKALSAAYEKRLFVANRALLIVGVVLSAGLLAAAALAAPGARKIALLFILVWLTGWSFAVTMLGRQVVAAWRDAKRRSEIGKKLGRSVAAVMLTAFALPFFAGEVAGLVFAAILGGPWMMGVFAGLIVLNVMFYHLLKAPTVEGRAVLDRIEGFRMYLATAEADLLNAATPPEKTPELFERYLPYAIALGVENEWGAKFEGVLAAAGRDAAAARDATLWSAGAVLAAGGAGAFASSLGTGFSGALS
ncbi:MAG TPA: DUF2207 domain-containing protein, partial [Phycisphaerales bacterium]|nr:DUF2207 domain-containing protein [Phycisphaerales bacterium]